MRVFRLPGARLAEKGQSDLAHGVEGGQEGSNCQSNEDDQVPIAKCIGQDSSLDQKPAVKAGSQKGQSRR